MGPRAPPSITPLSGSGSHVRSSAAAAVSSPGSMLACLSICWLTRLVASRFHPSPAAGRKPQESPHAAVITPFAFRQQKPGLSCLDGFATKEGNGETTRERPPATDRGTRQCLEYSTVSVQSGGSSAFCVRQSVPGTGGLLVGRWQSDVAHTFKVPREPDQGASM